MSCWNWASLLSATVTPYGFLLIVNKRWVLIIKAKSLA
jgi:hypothetical protein|tara:strand:+ start:354 stop:467 length:114 start_codon:yes stop_codon:yes gene_type:complete